MKKLIIILSMVLALPLWITAQNDDLYYVPKKQKKTVRTATSSVQKSSETFETTTQSFTLEEPSTVTFYVADDANVNNHNDGLRDVDEYNRRYTVEETDSGYYADEEQSIRQSKSRINDENWVSDFEGSDADYEYATRIIRFRNPRFAIPISSPLYWDVVYGGGVWLYDDWNVYDDGLYAYVFPTYTNRYYRPGLSIGWSSWGFSWNFGWYTPYYNPWYWNAPYYGWGGYAWNGGWGHSHHPHWGGGGWGGGWNGHVWGTGRSRRNEGHRTSSVYPPRPSGTRVGNNSSRTSGTAVQHSDERNRRPAGSSATTRNNRRSSGTATDGGVRNSSPSYDRPSSTRTTTRSQGTATTRSQGTATTRSQGSATTRSQGSATTRSQGSATTRSQGSATTRSQSTPSTSRNSGYNSSNSRSNSNFNSGSSFGGGGGSSRSSGGGSSRSSGGGRR